MTAAVAVGDELPPQIVHVTRTDLVRYAGASLDFNPIHHSDHAADAAGLPGVIAHGMLTMALACRLVTDWIGHPGAIADCAARFTRPIVVPDDGVGAAVELSGTVTAVESELATVAITAKHDGKTVLGKAKATVRIG